MAAPSFTALPNELFSIVLLEITSFETLKNLLLAYPPFCKPIRGEFDRIIASIAKHANLHPFLTLIIRVTVIDCSTKGPLRQATIRNRGKEPASALIDDSFGGGLNIRRIPAKDETASPTEAGDGSTEKDGRLSGKSMLKRVIAKNMYPHQPPQKPHPFPSEAPPPIDARTRQLADLPNDILHLLLLEIPGFKTLENPLVADPALFFPLADARLTELVDSIA
ncbi:MAG: hypothetical protein L6R37_006723 [Teloschistes peruensis]|nr:MAG: hypothetical protein L6R37_006723 [Teloschistes peruensis]